jgi:hypothetical protein
MAHKVDRANEEMQLPFRGYRNNFVIKVGKPTFRVQVRIQNTEYRTRSKRKT